MTNETYHLVQALNAAAMVASLTAILGTLLRARLSPTLFQREGYKIFGIYHVAMYGEQRANTRRKISRNGVDRRGS